MTADYTIDISKNTMIESKEAKIARLIYMYGFLFIGIYFIIYTLIKHNGWSNYAVGLVAITYYITLYLRMKGKWIYKRYFSITPVRIKWQKHIFDRANIKWSAINQISFKYSSIDFHLTTNKIKRFSLGYITAQQIAELNELISQVSKGKGIKYIAE